MKCEIAIWTRNVPGAHTPKEGDIISVRHPATGIIGARERKNLVWLLVDIANPFILDAVAMPETNIDGSIKDRMGDHRRYMVPLLKLKQIMSGFDMDKARDKNMEYQPFCSLKFSQNKWQLSQHQVVPFDGLIIDKKTGSPI
jgi:hypothetical protein